MFYVKMKIRYINEEILLILYAGIIVKLVNTMKERKEMTVDNEIRLKELSLDEVELIFNMFNQQREYFSEWLPFVENTNQVSDTRMFVEAVLNNDSPDITCAIFYNNEFVGLVGLKETDMMNHKVEIGYWLSADYQKKGIITRACKTMIGYAFNEMGMNKVALKAAVGNVKSQRVAERLGFVRDGIERAGELHSRGYMDLVVYSLLRSEWKN